MAVIKREYPLLDEDSLKQLIPKINSDLDNIVDAINNIEGLKTQGQGQQLTINTTGGTTSQIIDIYEKAFDYKTTFLTVFSGTGKLLSIRVKIDTEFTRGTKLQISNGTDILLYDTEIMLHITKTSYKIFYLDISGIIQLTLTGSPTAGAGTIAVEIK